jgi:uncharacterized protein
MDSLFLTLLVLLLTGILVGFASGLLGLGGGFLMVPVQFWILTSLGTDPTLALRISFGTSLAVVIPTALSSAWGHYCRDCVLVRPFTLMILPCIAGAFIGAMITTHLPGHWMGILFGLVLILVALRMGSREPHLLYPVTPVPLTPARYISCGLLFGIVSGMLGIGGGIVMVPIMVSYMRFSMHQAIGTSTALMIGSAVSGVLAYIASGWGAAGLPAGSFGYVNLYQWLPLVAMSIPMAQLGVRAAHHLPQEKIRLIFMAAMVITGAYMVVSGLR